MIKWEENEFLILVQNLIISFSFSLKKKQYFLIISSICIKFFL